MITHVQNLITALDQSDLDFNAKYIGDGRHTIEELYDFRRAYNAALFNEWAEQGKYDVHKSMRHYSGERCFGGGRFIVVAMLPGGQISNHYKMKYWKDFNLPETARAKFEWDGHNSADTITRINEIL